MSEDSATVHASAVKIGNFAVLIRGPSGSGKSRLAFDLIMAGCAGLFGRDSGVHMVTISLQAIRRRASGR